MKPNVRGLFVTGTDTGVGKTEVACALLGAAGRLGWRAVGMKPVAAGARRLRACWTNDDVEALDAASAVRVAVRLRNPYLLRPPVAPHIAAREAGVQLRIDVILRAYRELARHADLVVVEGAGGFRVPLSEHADLADLAARLRLPVVLVVGVRLGCLSHALLTAEAIERRGLELAGWVANRIDPTMRRYDDNVSSLRARLAAPLIAELPFVRSKRARRFALERALDVAAVAGWFRSTASGAQ